VFDVLLQVLDDGRLTDGQGRTVDFRNTILVLTSNLGSQYLTDQSLEWEEKKAAVHELVRQAFKPEFVNRLDDIVEFDQLTREQIVRIVDVQVARLIERVAERGIQVELSDGARTLIANLGYDPTYGARPLKRVIQKRLVDKLALALLEGRFSAGDTVLVGAAEGELTFEAVPAAAAAAA
jgi:ATP-dependent Clp protease ATP-binding subunit ClpB